MVHERLDPLLTEAHALRDADDPGAALFTVLDRLVTDAVTKADLIDAIAHAGAEVQATVDATSADLHRTLGHLLTRAQSVGTTAPTRHHGPDGPRIGHPAGPTTPGERGREPETGTGGAVRRAAGGGVTSWRRSRRLPVPSWGRGRTRGAGNCVTSDDGAAAN